MHQLERGLPGAFSFYALFVKQFQLSQPKGSTCNCGSSGSMMIRGSTSQLLIWFCRCDSVRVDDKHWFILLALEDTCMKDAPSSHVAGTGGREASKEGIAAKCWGSSWARHGTRKISRWGRATLPGAVERVPFSLFFPQFSESGV